VDAPREHDPRRSGCGFLAGGLFHCPDTGQPYVFIEAAIPLPGPSGSYDLKRVIAQGRSLAERELEGSGRHLVGWYHVHPAPHATLSRGDADAHLTFFDRPWHVGLVVASGDEPAGGFFCRSASPGWLNERLPFYEVLPDELGPGNGPRTTVVPWGNYQTDEEVVAASDVAVAVRERAQARVLFPDEFDEEPAEPSPRRPSLRRAVRYAAYGLAVLVPTGLFGVYFARAKTSPPSPAAVAPPTPAMRAARIDALGDSVALATAAFDLRVRLLETRRMACPDVARGLVEVEERWMAYNVARRSLPVTSDSARSARDQALYADVDAVERRFERSPCPRP
jgi:proteasome lid subunit RPN8/RPN11